VLCSRSTAKASELGELPRSYGEYGTAAIALRKWKASIVTSEHLKLRSQAFEGRPELA
jgi:hypothetical protein